MLAFVLPGALELIVIGLIFLFLVALPLAALIVILTMLANKRRKTEQIEQKRVE